MASDIGGNKPRLLTAAATLLAVISIMLMGHIFVEATDTSAAGGYSEEAMKARHHKWMAEHGRTYNGEAEKAHRFQVFKENAAFVDRSNAAGANKYRLAVNKFADMTNDEFVAIYTGFKPVPTAAKKMPGFKYENLTLSDDDQQAVDWREKGAVTGVKNQGTCGNYSLSSIYIVE
jgi:cathepsin L